MNKTKYLIAAFIGRAIIVFLVLMIILFSTSCSNPGTTKSETKIPPFPESALEKQDIAMHQPGKEVYPTEDWVKLVNKLEAQLKVCFADKDAIAEWLRGMKKSLEEVE